MHTSATPAITGKAWQTPLGRYAPRSSTASPGGAAFGVVLQLPSEGILSQGGGIQFVLKRAQGSQPEWLTGPDSKDFFVDITQVRFATAYTTVCAFTASGPNKFRILLK